MNTESFISAIDRSAGDDGCWLWKRGKTSFGYGSLNYYGANRLAHRVAWEVAYGEIPPDSLCILHQCDTPSCCNPDHLFPGTRVENNRDKTAKGRNVVIPQRGSSNPMSKLNAEQVMEIRKLYSSGSHTTMTLGKKFGVTFSLIAMIVRRDVWKHI